MDDQIGGAERRREETKKKEESQEGREGKKREEENAHDVSVEREWCEQELKWGGAFSLRQKGIAAHGNFDDILTTARDLELELDYLGWGGPSIRSRCGGGDGMNRIGN